VRLRGNDGGHVSEFLAMGGYGFYVWGAYGVTALVIVAELVAVRARRRAAEALVAGTSRAETAR
jgi:heme exporter protein D